MAGREPAPLLSLEIPQPEILLAGAVAVTGLEAAALGHGYSGFVGEWNTPPGVGRIGGPGRIALRLKFEQRAGTQQTMHFTNVALDDRVAGDVLEHDGGEGEVEHSVAEDR